MSEQRDRAKADAKSRRSSHADLSAYKSIMDAGPIAFTGYDEVVTESTVRGILLDGVVVPSAAEGAEIEIVLDRTPFYAESGGQLADQGLIQLSDGGLVEVLDVQCPTPGVVVHRGRVSRGEVTTGAGALGQVDVDRRRAISRAHTATHLVHQAFRNALGETATQAGSENAPGRFRFDFSATVGASHRPCCADVEHQVNEVLAADLAVHAEIMSQEQARASGAMALFGEKYGDRVRVVSVGDWARELCGGTHARRSGQLGLVKILGEASIGAGVRRVEALVGVDAYQFLAREHLLVAQLMEALKVPREELPERVAALTARLREAEKDLERVRSAQVLEAAASLAANPTDVYGVAVVAHRVPDETGGRRPAPAGPRCARPHPGRPPGSRGRHHGRRRPAGGRRGRQRPRPGVGRQGRRAGARGGERPRWRRRRQGRRRPGRRDRRVEGRRGAGPGPARGRPTRHQRL